MTKEEGKWKLMKGGKQRESDRVRSEECVKEEKRECV